MALVPVGDILGVSETYTMLSAAAADAAERDTLKLPAAARALAGSGFETIRLGGGGGGFGLTPSEQAAKSVTDVIAMIRWSVPSARTASPLSGPHMRRTPFARLLTGCRPRSQTPPSKPDSPSPASQATRAAPRPAPARGRRRHRRRRRTAPSAPPSPSRPPATTSPSRGEPRHARTRASGRPSRRPRGHRRA